MSAGSLGSSAGEVCDPRVSDQSADVEGGVAAVCDLGVQEDGATGSEEDVGGLHVPVHECFPGCLKPLVGGLGDRSQRRVFAQASRGFFESRGEGELVGEVGQHEDVIAVQPSDRAVFEAECVKAFPSKGAVDPREKASQPGEGFVEGRTARQGSVQALRATQVFEDQKVTIVVEVAYPGTDTVGIMGSCEFVVAVLGFDPARVGLVLRKAFEAGTGMLDDERVSRNSRAHAAHPIDVAVPRLFDLGGWVVELAGIAEKSS